MEARRSGTNRLGARRILVSVCFLVAAVCSGMSAAHAATYYWVGTSGGNTNSSSNWATSNPASCTGGGAGVPGSGDSIIFDPDCDNSATINANLAATSIEIQNGYSGTITQATGITVTVSGWTQAGGTFAGGNSTIDVNGSFTMSGGTFTSTSGSVQVSDAVTITGGIFNHNSGTLALDGSGLGGVDASGVTFNLVTVTRTISSPADEQINISAGTTIPLGNSPTVTPTNTHPEAGLFDLRIGSGATITIGTGTLTINGGRVQT